MPAQSSRSIGFLMPVGSSLTLQVRRLNDFRPTAGKRRGAPPRPSCETTASTPAAARQRKFSSALRAVAVECMSVYVAAQLSCRKIGRGVRKNALESARRCVSKDVALQVGDASDTRAGFRA